MSSSNLHPSDDPCQRLCDEFSADRRGAGYDLCESSDGSRCVENGEGEICENLFWSNTDDGQRGLIFQIDDDVSSDDDDLVSCVEAASIANVFLNKYFHPGLEIFANFRVVQEILAGNVTNEFQIALRDYMQNRTDVPRYSALKNLQDYVDVSEINSVTDMVMELAEATQLVDVIFDTHLSDQTRCTDCGNLFVGDRWITLMNLPAIGPAIGRRPRTIIDLFDVVFRITAHQQFDCPECSRNTESLFTCRLRQVGEVLPIRIVFELSPDGVVIPDQIDLAPYSTDPQTPLLYRLVAVANYGPESAVRRGDENQWDSITRTSIIHSGEMGPIMAPPIVDDSYFDTFFYQRVSS